MKADEFGTAVLEEVTSLATVEDSLIVAYRGALVVNDVPQETIDKVMTFVEARKTEIANALLANTPAAPPADGGGATA